MAKRKTRADWLRESDEWDKKSLEELIAESEPTDIKFIDRRPRKAISLRIDEAIIKEGKTAADGMGLGYQTLFRMWLIEGLRRHREQKSERRSKKTRSAA